MTFSSNNREWIFCVLGFLMFAISEISNDIVKIQTPLFENSVQRSLQETSLVEEKIKELESQIGAQKLELDELRSLKSEVPAIIEQNNILRNEVERLEEKSRAQEGKLDEMLIIIQQIYPLKNEVERLKEKLGTQEGKLNNQLEPLQTEVQNLKSKIRKTFYLKTSVDDWEFYSSSGITVKVDFSHLKLKNKPYVEVSLHGTSHHWETSGSNSVEN